MIDIDNLIHTARKSKNQVELQAYQNIKVEIQKNQTAKGAKPLTDQSQLAIIAKYAATLEHAIYEFQDAHRDDLVASYTSELEVVRKLLPAPVNESQIHSELLKWAKSNYEMGQSLKIVISKKEMGTAIKHLKMRFPTADGKMISEIVKKYIV